MKGPGCNRQWPPTFLPHLESNAQETVRLSRVVAGPSSFTVHAGAFPERVAPKLAHSCRYHGHVTHG